MDEGRARTWMRTRSVLAEVQREDKMQVSLNLRVLELVFRRFKTFLKSILVFLVIKRYLV